MAAVAPSADDFKFDVFISYSRKDLVFARKLQRALGNYAPPPDLPVAQRRLRVFRDESDFRGNEYGSALESMLRSSAKLLVICSPNSRASAYVGGEIASFAAIRGKEHIVSALVSGRPNNEAGDAEPAFHDELVGRLPVPLAAEYRGWNEADRVDRDRFEGAWFKLIADIYGVERSDIEGREKARQRRTRRIRTALVSALVLVLASLTTWALLSRNEAIRQGNTAQSRFLASQSMSGAHSFDVAMLLAVAAHRTAPTSEAWEALFVGLQRLPNLERFLHGAAATVRTIAFTPGSGCAAAWTDSDRTIIWNVADGKRLAEVAGRAITDASCASLVVATQDGALESRPLQGDRRAWRVEPTGSPVTAWTSNPAGLLLAIADSSGRIVLRDPTDGQIRAQHSAPSSQWRYLRFSADGRSLAAIDRQSMVHRFDADTLGPSASPVRCSARSPDVFAISPDLRWCASGGPGQFQISDLTREGSEIDLGTEWVLALDFSPDGRTLMTGVQGGNLRLRSMDALAREGRRARASVWSEHRADVTAAVYASSGAIVSAARDLSVIVWGHRSTARFVSQIELAAKPAAVAANANTSRIAVGTATGDVLLSDDREGRSFERLASVGSRVTALGLRERGDVLAGTDDGRLLLVTKGAEPRLVAAQKKPPALRIRLSADGSRAAVLRADSSLSILQMSSGSIVGESPARGPARRASMACCPAWTQRSSRAACVLPRSRVPAELSPGTYRPGRAGSRRCCSSRHPFLPASPLLRQADWLRSARACTRRRSHCSIRAAATSPWRGWRVTTRARSPSRRWSSAPTAACWSRVCSTGR
jgi:WD40 repeat protein